MTNRSMPHIFIAALAAVVIMLPTPAHARYTISCSSSNYRYQYCGANTDGYARLLSQQSRAACVRGRTWGYDNGGVWVNNGCSAQFEVGGSSRSGSGSAGAAVAAGVGLAILGAIIANQDQDNDGGYVPPQPYPQPYPAPYPPPYPYESAVPAWAIGTFHGTNAAGQPQTISINPDGAVTLRNRSGSVERGYYSGEMANLPSGPVGINPAGSGILVNGMYFAR
jgi:hypothetical protein